MKKISIGKYRNLQQCATSQYTFAILALDHRNNLRKLLNLLPADLDSERKMIEFKLEIVGGLSKAASAVLLDPELGAGQSMAEGVVPSQTGLIVALEQTGYAGDADARESNLLSQWNAEKTKRMGATGAKLLVYYHPNSPTAQKIEELVKQVAADCEKAELALFIEPLSYSLDPQKKAMDNLERREVVIETARRLAPLGADVLKAEFPYDVAFETDLRKWEAACRELSEASPIPWVLLSASVEFETYTRQSVIAFENGASGVAVGRAVWKEATSLKDTERRDFIQTTAYQRMKRTTALCEALARPWTDFYSSPEIPSGWYKEY